MTERMTDLEQELVAAGDLLARLTVGDLVRLVQGPAAGPWSQYLDALIRRELWRREFRTGLRTSRSMSGSGV